MTEASAAICATNANTRVRICADVCVARLSSADRIETSSVATRNAAAVTAPPAFDDDDVDAENAEEASDCDSCCSTSNSWLSTRRPALRHALPCTVFRAWNAAEADDWASFDAFDAFIADVFNADTDADADAAVTVTAVATATKRETVRAIMMREDAVMRSLTHARDRDNENGVE